MTASHERERKSDSVKPEDIGCPKKRFFFPYYLFMGHSMVRGADSFLVMAIMEPDDGPLF